MILLSVIIILSCVSCSANSDADILTVTEEPTTEWTGSYNDSYIYMATTYTHIRTEPNVDSQIVGTLTKNMIIPGLEPVNNWIPINYYGYLRYVYAPNFKQTAKPLNGDNKMTFLGTYKSTGYDQCYTCCGKTDGITASGTHAVANRTVALKGYSYGQRIYIEGLGFYIVEDTGGFSKNTIDIFCNNHTECYAITGYRQVYLVD